MKLKLSKVRISSLIMRGFGAIVLGLLCCISACAAKPPQKIKGGGYAEEGEFPYFVSIRYTSEKMNSKCGGTILNERYILTAAHCIEGREAIDLEIVTGSIRFGNGTHYKIEKVIPYGHNTLHYEHDIGLLKTNQDIVFNDKVKPVTLPTEDIQGYGQEVQGVGYGRVGATSDFPYELKKVFLTIENQKECRKLKSVADDTRFCTYNRVGQGMCFGDSGGPLLLNDTIVGVFIRMFPCGTGKPDMFTRVYSYLDWIHENIKL